MVSIKVHFDFFLLSFNKRWLTFKMQLLRTRIRVIIVRHQIYIYDLVFLATFFDYNLLWLQSHQITRIDMLPCQGGTMSISFLIKFGQLRGITIETRSKSLNTQMVLKEEQFVVVLLEGMLVFDYSGYNGGFAYCFVGPVQ